jgi:hypothetical protein
LAEGNARHIFLRTFKAGAHGSGKSDVICQVAPTVDTTDYQFRRLLWNEAV